VSVEQTKWGKNRQMVVNCDCLASLVVNVCLSVYCMRAHSKILLGTEDLLSEPSK
jgi:hypothetical protein